MPTCAARIAAALDRFSTSLLPVLLLRRHDLAGELPAITDRLVAELGAVGVDRWAAAHLGSAVAQELAGALPDPAAQSDLAARLRDAFTTEHQRPPGDAVHSREW